MAITASGRSTAHGILNRSNNGITGSNLEGAQRCALLHCVAVLQTKVLDGAIVNQTRPIEYLKHCFKMNYGSQQA
jgi:hypothetical protein